MEHRKLDALRLIYGSVPDTLSQLIRTAFVAPEGHVLIDADFSAIEARVISWLAGEQWRLEVFRTHGKIYEASASQMFGVPIELIKKGNPEYALRQKGKVAELALGYQGSTGALINMGALDMGIPEEDLPDIVSRWREANKRIRDLWYSMDNAAVQVITQGGSVGINGLLLAREYGAGRSSGKRKTPSAMPRTITKNGQWNSTYKNSLQWEAERRPMKKDWEIYRDTGILGGYIPEQAKLRRTEDGEVATVFRDTVTHEEEDCIAKQREMLIGGRRFCITSVFPAEPSATPTDKLIACIDAELEKEAHSA